MSVFCSSCPALLGAVDDLSCRALGVFWQHLYRRVPALCQHLAVSQFGVAAFSEAAMPERCERQFIAKASSADDFFDFAAHVREVRLIRLRPCWPWSVGSIASCWTWRRARLLLHSGGPRSPHRSGPGSQEARGQRQSCATSGHASGVGQETAPGLRKREWATESGASDFNRPLGYARHGVA
jgi:hypothetical protein